MKKLLSALHKLGLTNARAVSEREIAGASQSAFRSLNLCPFTDLPNGLDWQTSALLEIVD